MRLWGAPPWTFRGGHEELGGGLLLPACSRGLSWGSPPRWLERGSRGKSWQLGQGQAGQSDGGEKDAVGEQSLGCLGSPRKQLRSPVWPGGARRGPWLRSSPFPRTARQEAPESGSVRAELGLPLLPCCPSAAAPHPRLPYCPPSSPKPPRSGFGSRQGLLIVTGDKGSRSLAAALTARAWRR